MEIWKWRWEGENSYHGIVAIHHFLFILTIKFYGRPVEFSVIGFVSYTQLISASIIIWMKRKKARVGSVRWMFFGISHFLMFS